MPSSSAMKSTIEQLDHVPVDESNRPMIQISCASAEHVRTRDGNKINIGPVVVKRWVSESDDLRNEIVRTQTLCEKAISEDRQTIASMVKI
jgi:hypothetical protein